MRIFIDESGSFSWNNKGKSLFCGLTVSDSQLSGLNSRFLVWKKSIDGGSKAELKGQNLTANQLYSFASKVLPRRYREIYLSYRIALRSSSVTSMYRKLRRGASARGLRVLPDSVAQLVSSLQARF